MFFNLTQNTKITLLADFFWNIGRSLPHAILQVFLLDKGYSLIDIAFIQMTFKTVCTILELPSGIVCDIFSRKKIYILSLIILAISFIIIGLLNQYFVAMVIAYGLYGVSQAFKSGTLDSELVIEYKNKNLNIKDYAIADNQVRSFSGILGGGIIGALLYSCIQEKLYFISSIMFLLSIFIASFFKSVSSECNNAKSINFNDIKRNFLSVLKFIFSSKITLNFVLLLFITTIFLQSFYQYWQVLYNSRDIPIKYFGMLYIMFQCCNIIGSFLFKNIKINKISITIILLLMPIIYAISFIKNNLVIFIFPCVILLFYIHYQYINILKKQLAPITNTSTFFSVLDSIESVFGILTMLIIPGLMNFFDIIQSYGIIITTFSVLTIINYITFLKQLSNNKDCDSKHNIKAM